MDAFSTKFIVFVIMTTVLAGLAPYFILSYIVQAQDDQGLSEAVKQNPDGTKVRLSGEKIDVDLTKGTTTYTNDTGLPILTGYITNFTPDRIVTNMIFEVQFKDGNKVTFPLNPQNTKVNLPPWAALQWEHILTYDQKLKIADPNSYSTLVRYDEIDIYKQHAQQQEAIAK